jgi:hypothetical protein
MSANAESPAVASHAHLLPAAQILPGNVDSGEKFPDFCLHGQVNDSASNRTSVYSQLSTTSTSPTEYSSPDQESSPLSTASRQRTASSSPAPRSRRDKKELHAARLERSGSNNFALGRKESQSKSRRFHRGSDPAAALAAIEPPHDLYQMVRLVLEIPWLWLELNCAYSSG